MRRIVYKAALILLIACENDNLEEFNNHVNDELTVEAYIEYNKTPVVYLTTPLPVNGFKEIDFIKSVESTAKVEILGENKNEIATFSKDDTRFPSRFYAFNNIKGEIGELYKLKITIGDKVYLSETKIPKKPVLLDVSVVKQSTFKDGIYNLKIDLENNPNVDSYYKFYIKKTDTNLYEKASVFVASSEFVKEPVFTIYNDFFKFTEDSKKTSLLQNNTSFNLRVVSISKQEFEFWDKVVVSQSQIVNLPSLAQEIPTNISNDGFGFFSGNNEIFTTITID